MIAVGIATLIVGVALCVWAADAGQARTERIRYIAAWSRRGQRRGEKAGRQLGGWR